MKRKILALFAHPDDETICAGTLANYAQKGVSIILLSATKGEGGQSGIYQNISGEEMGKIRENELNNAAKILGIKRIYFLGFTDGTLKNTDQNEIKAKIKAYIEKLKPAVLITWDPEGLTRHPDHISISTCATMIALKTQNEFGFPKKIYWMAVPKTFLIKNKLIGMDNQRVFGVEDSKITTSINVEDYTETKIQAIQAHKSQLPVMIKYLDLEKKLKKDSFILVNSLVKTKKLERDLFYGI